MHLSLENKLKVEEWWCVGHLSTQSVQVDNMVAVSNAFVVWDYLVFSIMLVISAVIGIYYAFIGGGQNSSEEFLTAGRKMSAVPVAISLSASFMSAVTVLGSPVDVYRFGAVFCYFGIAYTMVVIFTGLVYLPVFYDLGITSTNEVRTSIYFYVRESIGALHKILRVRQRQKVVLLRDPGHLKDA